jgi:hypothetical protein
MLVELKQEMGLSEIDELEYLEVEGIQDVFEDQRSRIIVLINLIKLSYVDGAFEIEEECLVKQIARAFDVAENDFLLLDNWVRRLSALEEEAEAFFN